MAHRRKAIIVLVVGLTASTALADLTWTAEVAPGEPTPDRPRPAPGIRVKVVGEPLPSPAEWSGFVLRHDPTDVRDRGGVKPVRAIPYHLSTETLGLVVLIEGHEYYVGNDSYKQAQTCGAGALPGAGPCRIAKVTAGIHEVLRLAFEAPGSGDDPIPTTISRAGPPGSKGALVVYGTSAERRFEGDLTDLTGDKLGDQRTQEGQTSREFAAGLRLAQQTLNRMGTRRKALLVFSDGFDAGGSAAIEPIKRQLRADDVEVFAFNLDAASEFIADEPATVRTARASLDLLADRRVVRARDQDALRVAIAAAVLELNSRFTLVFPGHGVDPVTKAERGFRWDGRAHPLQLFRGDEQLVNYDAAGAERPVVPVLAPRWGVTAGGGRWWLWVAVAVGATLLVIVAVARRRRAPSPRPAIALPATVTAPVASAPPNSARTIMVDLASGDGLPVVGWIVPIQGDRQFQTFKLQYGETRIGTTADAHIVLGDGFMSTDHARVVMSPSGFTLVDNGSTNGTFANERRVHRHELVDNDVIMFGKTVCKFKTIVGT